MFDSLSVIAGRPCPESLDVRTSKPLRSLQAHYQDLSAGCNVWSGASLRPLLRLQDRQGMRQERQQASNSLSAWYFMGYLNSNAAQLGFLINMSRTLNYSFGLTDLQKTRTKRGTVETGDKNKCPSIVGGYYIYLRKLNGSVLKTWLLYSGMLVVFFFPSHSNKLTVPFTYHFEYLAWVFVKCDLVTNAIIEPWKAI